ncbi:DNA cytosine methyltransferase [Anaerorhabdus sp.]|uniref:DNA cytosine methyltransferase n=1 Tax=Anaerorhabdus sp. TaxID=1872524 RepID=UPI002FCB5DA9
MKNRKIKLATVFSGIGSVEYALARSNISHEIVFACDNGDIVLEDIDYNLELKKIKSLKKIQEQFSYAQSLYKCCKKSNYVELSYKANYNILPNRFFYDVKLIDGTKFTNKVDLFVGGSPCQSFSSMGYQKGLEDARGTLFYDFARLISEIKPKVFIYENVQGLLNHDDKKTWKVMQKIFDDLGYHYSYQVLNSKDFGIPQNRNRLFVVGFRNKNFFKKFSFPTAKILNYTLQDFLIENCREGCFDYSNIKHEPGIVDKKYFLSDKVTKHVMSEGTKEYKMSPKTDLKIARPLLATMHKMHRAGVDNYITINQRLRRLTPRECLRLMGYGDHFKQVVSDTQMYKQCGNSIVVDVMNNILEQINLTGVFKSE